MKKISTCLFLLSMCLVACKKDKSPDKGGDSGVLHQISFNVSGFTQTSGPVTNGVTVNSTKAVAAAPITSLITQIRYLVYKSDGTLLHQVTQKSNDPSFGVLGDKLGDGTYTIIVAGGQDQMDIYNPATFANSQLTYNPQLASFTSQGFYTIPANLFGAHYNGMKSWGDTFYKQFSLTVAGTDINQNVVLDRVVSKLTLKITDVLPPSGTFVQITVFQPLAIGFAKPITNTFSVDYNAHMDVNTYTNFVASTYCISLNTPVTVDITYYGQNPAQGGTGTVLLAEKVVTNVVLQANHETTLTGSIFGSSGTAPGGNSFGVSTTNWNPNINQPF
ncbi:hypothetical protein [Mucilaginibacter sp. OK268]|uniref:hypothetical protein n=1 Tax=Mucilaginibacter sp. OK268 TaxID=1881048 RepID=UPI00116009D2|nr:hypothetical protein [Mucilaginibacter sp. OK268]